MALILASIRRPTQFSFTSRWYLGKVGLEFSASVDFIRRHPGLAVLRIDNPISHAPLSSTIATNGENMRSFYINVEDHISAL